MPFKIIRANKAFLSRNREELCWLCTEKLNLKLNDLVVIKSTRANRHAHADCAIKHKWATKLQINKILITS